MDEFSAGQPSGRHTTRQFSQELSHLHSRVLTLGGLVEAQVASAVQSLVESDPEVASAVIGEDLNVNSLEVSIDEECTQILARRQPKARDLRFILAVIKTITDLERIGDEAKRMARCGLNLSDQSPSRSRVAALEPLAQLARALLKQALDAFARMDAEAALGATENDRDIDREYGRLLRQELHQMVKNPHLIPIALNLMWSARALERIGDRSCNICEYVVYYVHGKTIRHTQLKQT
jgi:phosphate transport system protein